MLCWPCGWQPQLHRTVVVKRGRGHRICRVLIGFTTPWVSWPVSWPAISSDVHPRCCATNNTSYTPTSLLRTVLNYGRQRKRGGIKRVQFVLMVQKVTWFVSFIYPGELKSKSVLYSYRPRALDLYLSWKPPKLNTLNPTNSQWGELVTSLWNPLWSKRGLLSNPHLYFNHQRFKCPWAKHLTLVLSIQKYR